MSEPATMHDPLAPFLVDDGVLLLDGGLATALEERGHDLHDPLWSARLLLDGGRDAIAAVHDDYLAAGADVAIAASYQASLPGLRARGLTDAQARAVLRDAVDLARAACDRAALRRGGDRPRPLAVASLGAYGASLADGSEYTGDYAIDDAALRRFHRERLEVLAPRADLIACETIPCLREAECLAEVLAEHPEIPAWVSFSCRDGAHVGHGELVERCAAAVDGVPSVVAIGVNCTAPVHVTALVERLRLATARPLVVYPNAGERYADGQWCGTRTSPAELVDHAGRWHAAGARLIGGCCRTTPAHIAALHRWRCTLRAEG